MSSPATDILTAVLTQVDTTLGSSYQQIPFVHDVSKNDIRRAKLGFGVRSLDSGSTEGVNRVYTMDHRFELILTDTIIPGQSDDGVTTSIKTMYDNADTIFKSLVQTKLSLPSVVLNIFAPATSEPEILEEQKIVALRLQFTVKYRSALT